MKRCGKIKTRIMALLLCIALLPGAAGCAGKTVDGLINDVANLGNGLENAKQADSSGKNTGTGYGAGADTGQAVGEDGGKGASVEINRPMLLGSFIGDSEVSVSAALSEPDINSLDEAVNSGAFAIPDEGKSLLLANKFAVTAGYSKEFYQIYENNRYMRRANFVTVDAMMHAYHMYFAYLLKSTERKYLCDMLLSLSEDMLAESRNQYEHLKGTEWESAALRNVAYFTVAAVLQNENELIDDEVADIVNYELDNIYNASMVNVSKINNKFLDYSQFKPRGYYEGDAGLEKYFRAMMWYGQIGFVHGEEDLDRSAFLITIALGEGNDLNWEKIYNITSFFAGASDDLTYYEFRGAMGASYGKYVNTDEIIGDDYGWSEFRRIIGEMPAPAINSIPLPDNRDHSVEATEENKGFRFMGQRFSVDEAVFQQLIYDNVGANLAEHYRMLPDTLDVAAALGSDTAYDILREKGEEDYDGYAENMAMLKDAISSAGDALWSGSLYGSWLYTLRPLLEEKGDGYPGFMQGEEWAKKDIESFAGSYTELKHDTVLYAKQAVAEMGGDEIPSWDNRGYVEPEADVWARFEALALATASGLEGYGLIDEEDSYNLTVLADMASQFKTMSLKELAGELLTDAEYEEIEYFGGNLEHLWKAALADEDDPVIPDNFPAALVTDIATDPNGECLEVATGNPSRIYILVYFDGAYHICGGAMYSFYQFAWPLSDRLTDSEWRQMMGLELQPGGSYNYADGSAVDKPSWTDSYRYGN